MFDDRIEVVSPGGLLSEITEGERTIYKILSKTMLKPISEIAPNVPFSKSKITQLLKEME